MIPTATIYHVNGESFDVPEIDAKEAVTKHPDEYRTEPWNAEQRRAHELRKADERQAATAAAKERASDTANGKLIMRSTT